MIRDIRETFRNNSEFQLENLNNFDLDLETPTCMESIENQMESKRPRVHNIDLFKQFILIALILQSQIQNFEDETIQMYIYGNSIIYLAQYINSEFEQQSDLIQKSILRLIVKIKSFITPISLIQGIKQINQFINLNMNQKQILITQTFFQISFDLIFIQTQQQYLQSLIKQSINYLQTTEENKKNLTQKLKKQIENESFEYSDTDLSQSENSCSICLEEQQSKNLIIKTSCGHIFHSSCINEWFQKDILLMSCPYCRKSNVDSVTSYSYEEISEYQEIVNVEANLNVNQQNIVRNQRDLTEELMNNLENYSSVLEINSMSPRLLNHLKNVLEDRDNLQQLVDGLHTREVQDHEVISYCGKESMDQDQDKQEDQDDDIN